MRNLMSLILVAFTMFSVVTITTSCEKTDLAPTTSDDAALLETRSPAPTTDCVLYNPSETVSVEETELLKYMREEEKLARDVYIYFFNKYGATVFQNISKSEQRHMDRILCLLDYYEIEDPALAAEGEFTNPHIQELYDALTTAGDVSLLEAYKVGATIEDVDIKDLEDYSLQTENPAILQIFENLTCGSRNHMRAFYPLVIAEGGEYTAQFITQEELEAIINSDRENCGNGQNNGQKGKGNKGNGFKGNGDGICDNSGNHGKGNGDCDGTGDKGNNGNNGNGSNGNGSNGNGNNGSGNGNNGNGK